MPNYLLSQPLLDQIREDHKITKKNQGKINNKPKTGQGNEQRFLAKITGKYTDSGLLYPLEGTYRAVQVVSTSNGDFSQESYGLTWGETDSTSLPPLIDIVSLGHYNNETILKRIPNDTIVECFMRGTTDGRILWYCDVPEQIKPISFQAEFIAEESTGSFVDKIRIHSGVVYGKGFSTTIPETKYLITQNLYIYVTYVISFDDYTISSIGLGSSTGRPTEITDTSTTRTVKMPLVSFANDSTLLMTRYHEGDIAVLDNWYDGTQSPLDLTYTSEHTESALTDSGWDRNDQGSYSGVELTVQVGEAYYESGDEVLYMYVRDLLFDQEGKLVSVSAETRVAVETPESC